MRLIHYSNELLGPIHSKEQDEGRSTGIGKPKGLWVSVEGENDWASWCKSEQFRDCYNQIHNEITLAPDARILYLNTPEEIDKFTEEYIIKNDDPKFGRFMDYIDWAKVAGTYQGIVIAPYQWTRRMTEHTWWYYGWDCASGCIWDATAIQSTRVVTQPERMIREDEE